MRRGLRGSRCLSSFIQISETVQGALRQKQPVVALESTIISHGMPYPQNLQVARLIEQTVLEAGAIPATVGVINGIPTVGLDSQELALLAMPSQGKVYKCSTKDLAYLCAQGATAATTVSSTSYLASQAGVRVFATGGMGGVHYGAESTFDISADLHELSRTNMTVVCAGIKSILDIPKTLEMLETLGVPVLTYKTNTFPAFFSNNSGIPWPHRVDSALEVAKMMRASDALHLSSGMVLAVPNPAPASSERVQRAILEALQTAEARGITGAKLTPFLLAAVNELTGGESLKANIELVLNNAKVAAQIAVEYSRLQHSLTLAVSSSSSSSPALFPSSPRLSDSGISNGSPHAATKADVLCVGAAVLDYTAKASSANLLRGSSNRGSLSTSLGGVARNIAEAAAKLGAKASPEFIVITELSDTVSTICRRPWRQWLGRMT